MAFQIFSKKKSLPVNDSFFLIYFLNVNVDHKRNFVIQRNLYCWNKRKICDVKNKAAHFNKPPQIEWMKLENLRNIIIIVPHRLGKMLIYCWNWLVFAFLHHQISFSSLVFMSLISKQTFFNNKDPYRCRSSDSPASFEMVKSLFVQCSVLTERRHKMIGNAKAKYRQIPEHLWLFYIQTFGTLYR